MNKSILMIMLTCSIALFTKAQNSSIVPSDGSSVEYKSSVACNIISTLILKQNTDGTVAFHREIKAGDTKEMPSRLIIESNIPETSNGVISIPDDGMHYWFIPFQTGTEPLACPFGVVVYNCSCAEAPADYNGSAYCALKVTFGSTNVTYCVHQACCECKLNKTGSVSLGGGMTPNEEGIILRATSVVSF